MEKRSRTRKVARAERAIIKMRVFLKSDFICI